MLPFLGRIFILDQVQLSSVLGPEMMREPTPELVCCLSGPGTLVSMKPLSVILNHENCYFQP